jgi:hypothetical protein
LAKPNDDKIYGKAGGILSEVLVVIGVEDGPRWVPDGPGSGGGLTGNVVTGAAVDDEVGRLVDKRSAGLGICTVVPTLGVSQKAPQRPIVPNRSGSDQEIF